MSTTAPFPIVIVGHVDHGKSTLIGRLLYDTDSLPEGRVTELTAISAQRGLALEWSFLLDALQIERDQGITVDTTRIWFRTPRRPYVIIDAPGHREFLRNMVTGASGAEAAVLVADAERGTGEQTRRHAFLISLLGIRQVVVAVNKMDLVDYAEPAFRAAAEEIGAYLSKLGLPAPRFVPLSARHGDNVAGRSAAMPWWTGPTLLETLDELHTGAGRAELPLRLPVQDVYRRGDRRIAAGRIDAGRLRVGDRVVLAPTGRIATIAGLEGWKPVPHLTGVAGQSVAIRFEEDAAVTRGQVIASPDAPPQVAESVRLQVFWLDGTPLRSGDRLSLRLSTAEHAVRVSRILRVIDIQTLSDGPADEVVQGGIAELVLTAADPIVFDPHAESAPTGRAALARDGRIVGGGILLGAAAAEAAGRGPVVPVASSVGPAEFTRRNGHGGGVVWLTGLSGAGKTTLAMAAHRALFDRGWHTAVLDGDGLRSGLNADLGFSAGDRLENIRRTAEVARLMADAGLLVLVSLISPAEAMRATARRIIGDRCAVVWVKAALDVCAARDPKGLYARARQGELTEFTGVSAPFEDPTDPDLVLDTGQAPVAATVQKLLGWIERRFETPAVDIPASAASGAANSR